MAHVTRCPLGVRTTVALLLLTASPGAAEGQSLEDGPPVLRSGDVLRVEVWRQPEFSGDFDVTAEGGIAHPLFRSLRVTGRKIEDVEADMRRFLGEYVEQPQLVVEGLVLVPVGGEVRAPDTYPLRLHTSIARAIALAGGATERGRLDQVVLRRNGELYTLDLTRPDESPREIEVRSGDEILVGRRADVFREYIAPSASVVAAIAAVLRLFL